MNYQPFALSCRLLSRFLPFIGILIVANAQATPVTFNFTGTITQAMYEHVESGAPSQVHAEWLGKPISGSVSIDIARAVDDNLHYSAYKSFSTDPNQGISAADWVTFHLVNPDGDEWDLPGFVPASSAYYSLLTVELAEPRDDHSHFSVSHGHETFLYPSFSIAIDFEARGENAALLLNSLELEDLVVQPQFANISSYGFINYYVAPDDTRTYGFSIDSFTRATSQVPEPASWMLAALALGGLMMQRVGFGLR